MCCDKKYTGTLTCQKCQQKNDAYFCKTRKEYECDLNGEVTGWVHWFTCPECGHENHEGQVENLKEANEAPWEVDEE